MLTEDQLRRIVPAMRADRVTAYLPHLNAAMAEFEIDSALRTAAFIAQLAHESGAFRWMKEIWGPNDAQRRYEPPGSLAAKLGNTQPGDGARFMGRGPIQLTGRSNYQRAGAALGLDLVGDPERAAEPEVGFRIAGLFWKSRRINVPADAGDIVEVTRLVNGGRNGLAERTDYYERAKRVLAEGFVPNPVARGAVRAGTEIEPLERGREPDAAPIWAEAAAPRKVPATKAVAKKAPAKKAVERKTAAKKAPAKKAPAKKAAAKKAARR